jgi:hypothetical protein
LTLGLSTDLLPVFHLEERGGNGASPWPDRFGRIASDSRPAQLRHVVDGNPAGVTVRSPLFEFTERLQENAEWTEGTTQYACRQQMRVGNRDVWVVEVTLERGRRQVLQIEADTGVVVNLQERLFLGQGEEHELTLLLEHSERVPADIFDQSQRVAHSLLQWQDELQRDAEGHGGELSAEQLAAAVRALGPLRELAIGTTWSRLVDVILRDIQQQSRRLEGIAGLVQQFVGQPITWPDLQLLGSQPLRQDDLTGQVVVLHFWDYDGDKLVEPYGQVGYLDFLQNRRGKLGVKVLGVAVDARVADPAQTAAVSRSVRKLQEFMNLSYPVALDDGRWLKTLGDPRTLGATLPLWVVVGHDGRIRHYHVGYYHLQPDEGLKVLDAAVVEALKQRGAAGQ